MPDGGQQTIKLGVLEAVSGHRQEGDQAGVDQQALGGLPATAHAHHVMQEDLGEGATGEGSSLQHELHDCWQSNESLMKIWKKKPFCYILSCY